MIDQYAHLALEAMMASPQLGHVTNLSLLKDRQEPKKAVFYKPLKETKPDKIINQHALIQSCR